MLPPPVLLSPKSAFAFANPCQESLLETVLQVSRRRSEYHFKNRSDVGYICQADDFILRIAYHEAVHVG
jgi:hypothetical protein